MSAADAFRDDDFESADDFELEAEAREADSFLDADAIERALLGDAPGKPAESDSPAAGESAPNPFGARLAEANSDDLDEEDAEFVDVEPQDEYAGAFNPDAGGSALVSDDDATPPPFARSFEAVRHDDEADDDAEPVEAAGSNHGRPVRDAAVWDALNSADPDAGSRRPRPLEDSEITASAAGASPARPVESYGGGSGSGSGSGRGGAGSGSGAGSSGDLPVLATVDGLYGEISEDEDWDQPVPRITIHAYCENPETGALIHNAAADRRLAKAHVVVELGGLPAAIERYHDEPTPSLLIVESGMRGRALFEMLDELAAVCEADTRVIIVGAANDVALYRELIRRGVSEYLVPPMTPLHLIRTIAGLFLDPESPFVGKTVAFIGAKGGVGSSTIAHNTAWAITESQQTDAVLVDMDLSFGTAGLDFNQDPPQTIAEALSEPDRLDDALLDRLLVRCTERLSLFTAPASIERDWDFHPEAYEEVVDKLRRQAPFSVLDLPHMWSPWVRSTLLSADQVVITAMPDLASLRNAKNIVDLLRSDRPNDEPPKLVINMTDCPKRPDIPMTEFANAIGVQPALVLPFEPTLFGKAANNGLMVSEIDASSKAAAGFTHLASVVTGRAPASPKKRGFLSSLFSRKKK